MQQRWSDIPSDKMHKSNTKPKKKSNSKSICLNSFAEQLIGLKNKRVKRIGGLKSCTIMELIYSKKEMFEKQLISYKK